MNNFYFRKGVSNLEVLLQYSGPRYLIELYLNVKRFECRL